MNTDPQKIPSLLDAEATGGETAAGGFTFQDGIAVSYVPVWLACDGFEALLCEGLGDIEASFYVPKSGQVKELIEVKDHQVTPAEFWAEIDRFQTLLNGATYRQFELVAHSFSPALQPLKNAVQRVRHPGQFYESDSAVSIKSYADYEKAVLAYGRSAQDARFLFDRVLMSDEQGVAASAGQALFLDRISAQPSFNKVGGQDLRRAFSDLQELIRGRANQPISRKELEATLWGAIDAATRPPALHATIFTGSDENVAGKSLFLDWTDFSGGTGRAYPSADRWNGELVFQARKVANWILTNRSNRQVHLEGQRRLTASIVLGATFSAVRGFRLSANIRGETWDISLNPPAEAEAYEWEASVESRKGDDLVVDISIVRDSRVSVTDALPALGLEGSPRLSLFGVAAIETEVQLATLVRDLKNRISEHAQETESKTIHLFLLGPAQLAISLGHRLNALGAIQCYEYTGKCYTPTARIST